ncbi:MAG: hypothetical protein JF628_12085 [Sphingomonas sp.]|nr:hypothetical protein [Sphingomonas sp.]
MFLWLTALALAAAPAKSGACAFDSTDKTWIEQALRNWRTSESAILKLKPAPLPTIVAIDASCTHIGRAASRAAIRWNSTAHPAGMVTLPDGKNAPIGPISFAAPDNGAARTGFFAISLPSVWRTSGVTSEIGLEQLMDGVLLHELMHTRQFYFVNPALTALGRKYHFGDDMSDDALQDKFKSDSAYVAAYQAETDMLYAAAAAASDAEARRLAGKALAMMRARRARWFEAENAQWEPLDDIFLTMEGLGQWLAYAWFVSPQGPGLDHQAAIAAVRRKRNLWTQDEGLGLFLVIDRLVPRWQTLAFAKHPALAEALLAKAADGPR